MQQYLYRIQPTRIGMLTDGPTEHEAKVIDEHLAYLQRLTAEGTVLTAGRTISEDERTFGIVIFLAESDATAAELVRNDPAVKNGVMRAELFPYHIALWSRTGPGGSEEGS